MGTEKTSYGLFINQFLVCLVIWQKKLKNVLSGAVYWELIRVQLNVHFVAFTKKKPTKGNLEHLGQSETSLHMQELSTTNTLSGFGI